MEGDGEEAEKNRVQLVRNYPNWRKCPVAEIGECASPMKAPLLLACEFYYFII